ncbi:MAG: dTDP-4-dehydrorhamnose reductase [Bacteroidales bacterium]|nr:dTDP-4-dehydrorhamnose reductase [Bacteroidales bacterium]
MAIPQRMKIAVIGRNGQLASSFFILKNDYIKDFKFKFYGKEDIDIFEKKNINKILLEEKVDYLINTSAYHSLPECEKHPEKAFLLNEKAVENLAFSCFTNKVGFITYSTDYVFDGKKKSPYLENDEPNPLQVYGLSKYKGEIAAITSNPTTIIIRTSSLYGGKFGSQSKGGNFVLTILKLIEAKQKLEIGSESIMSPTYALDLAEATLKLIKKKAKGGVYHLTNKGFCSWASFAKEIVRIKKNPCKVIPVDRSRSPSLFNRPRYSVLNNTRAFQLGINLRYWKKALKEYLYWLEN